MPLRRGPLALTLAASLCAACAATPGPAPVTISIAQAAPTPDPGEGAADAPAPPPDTLSLDNTQWTLHCDIACQIDYFNLHAGGKGNYRYHDGTLYPDAVWRYERGTLTISVNDHYATYRARRSATGFSDGHFENQAGFTFTFSLTRKVGGDPKHKD